MPQGIRKAVIAAAGFGTRFLPVVKAFSKQLVPVLGKPNIQYLVEELVAAGIKEIAITHRPDDTLTKKYFLPDPILEKYLKKTKKENLMESLDNLLKKIKRLEFFPQGEKFPYGNASPILAAKNFIGNDPFVYLYGDDLLLEKNPGETIKTLINTFEKYKADVVAMAEKVPMAEIVRYSSVKYYKNSQIPYQIEDVIEKPKIEEAPSNTLIACRFIVSPLVFKALAKQEIVKGELWFTDAVRSMAKNGIAIAQPVKGATWLTTGDPLRWLKANIEFGLKDGDIAKDLKLFLKEKGV